MLKNLKQRKEGFTIIEVLIVLAIAGLIMLVVFLAVPALQRNSRNTRLDADASKASGVLQEVINNNNGAAPVGVAVPTQMNITNGSYAQIGTVDYNVHATTYQALPATIAKDSIVVRNWSICGAATGGATGRHALTGGTLRQYTVTYLVESPGAPAGGFVPAGFAAKCVGL